MVQFRRILAAGLSASVILAGTPAGPASASPDSDFDAAAQRLGVLVEQYNGAREDVAATRTRTAAVTARIRPLATRLDGARNRMGVIAAELYRSGPTREANALLAATSPGEFADRLLVLGNLSRTQNAELARLVTLDDRLATERVRLAALQRRLAEQDRVLAGLHTQVVAQMAIVKKLRRSPGELPAPRPFKFPTATSGERWGAVVAFAYAQLGKRYKFGGEGPDRYDCSGLAMRAWQAAGIRLPHNAARQADAVPRITRSALRPGDLVFYYADRHHVGIYVGDGQIIHAPQSGDPVSLTRLDLAPIWGYGRPDA